MKYISWATFYEGQTDGLYLDVLLPRILRELVAETGTDIVEVPDFSTVRLGTKSRTKEEFAREACEFRSALDIIFVHADTGGRGVERNLADRSSGFCEAFHQRCGAAPPHCVTITPRHETEAWLLADPTAIMAALGFDGTVIEARLPLTARDAERLTDPKETLRTAVHAMTGRKRKHLVENLFPAIAQRQSLTSLRSTRSFSLFEGNLKRCLKAQNLIE